MTLGLLLKIIVGMWVFGVIVRIIGSIWLCFYPYKITWRNITSYQGHKMYYNDIIETISGIILIVATVSFVALAATTRFTPKEIVEFKEELNYQQLVKFLDDGNYVISDKVDVPTRISIEIEEKNVILKITETKVNKEDYVAIPKGDE